MRVDRTERGFAVVRFKDYYKNDCTLQKSSLAMIDCVWLGVNRVAGKDANEPVIIGNNRMHLTRDQVKKLLPHLRKFVKTGEIE